MKDAALRSATLGSRPHHAALLLSRAKERYRGPGPCKDSSIFGTPGPSGLSEAVLPRTSSCGLLLGLGESLLPSLGPQGAGENEVVDPWTPGQWQHQGWCQSRPNQHQHRLSTPRCLCKSQQGSGEGEDAGPAKPWGRGGFCFRVALPTGRTKEGLKRAPLGSQDRPEVGVTVPGAAALQRGQGCRLAFGLTAPPMPKRGLACQGYFHHFLRARRAWQRGRRAGAAPCPRGQGLRGRGWPLMLLVTGSGVQSKVRPDGIQLWTLGESIEGRPCPPGKDDGAALLGWCGLQTPGVVGVTETQQDGRLSGCQKRPRECEMSLSPNQGRKHKTCLAHP